MDAQLLLELLELVRADVLAELGRVQRSLEVVPRYLAEAFRVELFKL